MPRSAAEAEIPTAEPDPAQMLAMLRTMHTIRAFDDAAGRAHSDGHVRGSVHQYIGEEAIATVIESMLTGRFPRLQMGELAALAEEQFLLILAEGEPVGVHPHSRELAPDSAGALGA